MITAVTMLLLTSAGPLPVDSLERPRRIEAARAANDRAWLLWERGKRQEAVQLFLRVMKQRETLYPDGHPELADTIDDIGLLAFRVHNLPIAERFLTRALQMRERLYPATRYKDGHPELARSLTNVAGLYRARADFARAEPLARRAVQMLDRLFPKERYKAGHPLLARALTDLASLHQGKGEYEKAEPLFRRALQMYETLYPKERYKNGHAYLAVGVNNMAALYQAMGEYTKAEPLLRRALEMNERLYPKERYRNGHPYLASALGNLAVLYLLQDELAKAEPLCRRALEMYERLYPRELFKAGHPDLANSMNSLASLYQAQGEYARAEPLFRRALEMSERLYPKERYKAGHPDLVVCLNNLASLNKERDDHARAEALYKQALEMDERLYPKERYPHGHPVLAAGLTNLANLYLKRGEYDKAEALVRRALGMAEQLYPKDRFKDGHPDLAVCMQHLAIAYRGMGKYAKAEPPLRRALAMVEKLYPPKRYKDGHPYLALSLCFLATLHRARGEHGRAVPLLRSALGMYHASATGMAASSDEATALNFLARQPPVRDSYLSATRGYSGADTYGPVWQTKAILARLAERRNLAVLASASDEARRAWETTIALRAKRQRLLLAPADAAATEGLVKRLDEIDEQLRKAREALLPRLPALKRQEELARAAPAELRKALPADAAFVDFIRYEHFEQDPKVKGGKGELLSSCYAAFVVTRDGVSRVELKAARDIEEALSLWRRAIVEASPSEAKYAAEVHRLVWSPLLKHLPAKLSTVYVCPDAGLNQLPWPALRDGKSQRILLENHAVAVVPHGPFLLGQLTQPAPKASPRAALLVVGGVVYDRKPLGTSELGSRGPAAGELKWLPLTGTATELKQVQALAGKRRVISRQGAGASVAALLSYLPKTETAHLATHGFFADAKFRTVLQLDPGLFRSKAFLSGGAAERIGAGARSPLVLSGLVCSGANLPETPNRGVLTAEDIVGLDLRRMNLAVLSACETGLGEVSGGEGVYGLTRAFHVAGARNVVASLWKVDDEATAALMSLFYRQLWDEKNPVGPAEAMRRAQLALYREPGRVKEWAAGRGPIPKPIAAGGKLPDKPIKGKTSPTRAWAAFLVSGPGK
jgi:CHAT domain-containing protein/Tfp pilus assembly protein PilF